MEKSVNGKICKWKKLEKKKLEKEKAGKGKSWKRKKLGMVENGKNKSVDNMP